MPEPSPSSPGAPGLLPEAGGTEGEAADLTPRQIEVLSLCAAYPDAMTSELAEKLNVANSTIRNLLSSAYLRLGVRSRAAAVARAQQLCLIVPPFQVDY